MRNRRMTRAPAKGTVSRWSDLAFEITERIAEGVPTIPIAASAKNNHLHFLRPSYLIKFSEMFFQFNPGPDFTGLRVYRDLSHIYDDSEYYQTV